MVKKILTGIAFIVVFGLGIYLARTWYKPPEQTVQIESTVLLEKVQQVCKLVTVEGTFSEIYDETNIRQLTFYLPVATSWKFSKKAIIQVTGKVLVGYDLEAVQLTADSSSKTIYLRNLPKPQILSIDHQVQYKNLEESFFNSFSASDFTQLNQNAKEVLRLKAEESELLDKAADQGIQMLDAIQFIVESSGWNLRYEGQAPIPALEDEEDYMN
jgi:hypothetical protein